jgi:hypothetical protein
MILGIAMACSEATRSPVSPESAGVSIGDPRFAIDKAGNGVGQCMLDDARDAGFINNLSDSSKLGCTANDISIALGKITRYSINGGTFQVLDSGERISCVPGDVIKAVTFANIQNSASERYDIGLWINANPGGSALTGTNNACTHYNLVVGDSGVSVLESGGQGGTPDACGDVQSGRLVAVPLDTLTLTCPGGGATSVSVHACAAWSNGTTGGNDNVCPKNPPGGAAGFRQGTTPLTTSKCKCNPLVLPIDVKGSLQIVKRVVNDNGGTLTVSDFNVTSSAASLTFGSGVADGANTLKYSSQVITVDSGSYTLRESDIAAYSEGTWSCTGATPTNSTISAGAVVVKGGDNVVCTITNNDQAGSLQIVKRVVNDNGGTATVAAFGVTSSAGALTFGSGVADGANTLSYSSQVISVSAGSYTLRENDIGGYTEGSWSCTGATPSNTTITAGAVTVPLGTAVVCTITNDDVAGSLQIVKRVINNNGGTATVAAFGVTSDAGSLTFGSGVADGTNTLAYSSQVITVSSGSYTLRENDIAGYSEGTWSCTGATPSNNTISAGAVTVPLGTAVVCTITNDDIGGTLQIVKRVVNDNGGTAAVAAFGVNSSAGSLTFGSGAADGTNTLAYSSQVINVAAGSYTLRENDIAGYSEGTWSCTGATPSDNTINNGAVTVPLATNVVCTITNNDIAGSLQIVKRVVNNNGGTATVSAFGVNSSAGSLTFGSGAADGSNTLAYSSQVMTVNAGSYTLRENDIAGYTEGTWSCTGATPSNTSINNGAVTVPLATAVVCTITNDDVGGSLQIIKRVVNDNGGTATVSAFGVNTSAGSLTFDGGAADGANTTAYTSQAIAVSAGSYTLRENDIAGYSEGTWSCTGATPSDNTINNGAVTVPLGTAVVCTVTNNDVAGSLQIVKRVVNDNGGTATVTAFGVNSSAGALTFGSGAADGSNTLAYSSQVMTVNAGSYTLRENDIAGYTEGTWSCTGATPSNSSINNGAVTVPLATAVVCTITNNDTQGSLQIIKRVVNDNGGTLTVSSFGVNSDAGSLTFGSGVNDGANTLAYSSQVINVNAGSYTLRESDVAGYSEGTWSCTGATPSNNTITAGAVTVPLATAVVCTITNNDVAGSLQIVKRVVNDHGGTATVTAFGVNTTAGSLTFGSGVADGANTLAYSSQVLTVNQGSWTLRENDITGYTEGTWSCTGATPSNTSINLGAVTVPLATAVVCTITNDDQPATLIVKKIVIGAGATFAFTGTGSGVDANFTISPASDNFATTTFSGISAGAKSVTETILAGYVLTDLSCDDSPTVYDPQITQTVNTTLVNGGTVTCTFVNQKQQSQTTRTQGFWSTHLSIATVAWNGGTFAGNTFAGAPGDKLLCGKELDIPKLMGGFWSNIANKSGKGGKRSDIDKARMQLLQQLLAAELNYSAFGSTPPTMTTAAAEAAFCGSDIEAIKAAQIAMASFNESGDSGAFTPGASAEPKASKAIANIPYWDIIP